MKFFCCICFFDLFVCLEFFVAPEFFRPLYNKWLIVVCLYYHYHIFQECENAVEFGLPDFGRETPFKWDETTGDEEDDSIDEFGDESRFES